MPGLLAGQPRFRRRERSAGGRLVGHSTAPFIQLASLADLDLAEAALASAPTVKARHETFHGTTEFYVREPGGNVVGFASR